jgi:hypothetical protein
LKDESLKSQTLAELLRYCADDQLPEAVAAAKAISEADVRVHALAKLVNRDGNTVKSEFLLALIDAVGSASRKRTRFAVEAAASPTSELGEGTVILELCRSITDVCRWYP